MTDIKPGDLVVHVGTEFQCVVCEAEDAEFDDDYKEEAPIPNIGQVLTVRTVIYDDFPCPGLLFSDFPDGDGRAFASCCYRKVEKADEQFTEIVRACRPIKQKETAL